MNGTLRRAGLTALIGLAGGVLGFFLSERSNTLGGTTLTDIILHSALWAGLIAAPIAAVLVVADNLLGFRGRWHHGLMAAVLLGAVVGFLSGALAQAFYSFAGPNRLTRGIGWAMMGAGIGLMLGFIDRSPAKAGRGALGGFIGGLIGGLVFDSVTFLAISENDTGVMARLVGISILGAAIGLMLQLAQDLLKNTWLLGTSTGPYEGKQYILMRPRLTVGRHASSDICLMHDNDLPERAGSLIRSGRAWRWEGEPALINGVRQTSTSLNAGDRISFGGTQFLFESRGAARGSVTTDQYVLQGLEDRISLPVPLSRATLGSHSAVPIRGQGVQARHADIRVDRGTLKLQAHASVLVNDREILPGRARALQVGDVLQFGDAQYALIREK